MTAPRPDLAVVEELKKLADELRKGDLIPVQYEIWADALDALLARCAEMEKLLQDLRPALSVLRTMLLVSKLRLG